VAAAFLSYAGHFDTMLRAHLCQRWTHTLNEARIETRFR
jgi:hypothetical protein